ncbi:MAG: hypothetical protein WKF63_08280 [Thermomicrobiales bacterium]
MLDDILDLFKRDQNRRRPGKGVRGLLDRLGDHDDDRPSHPRHRDHEDDWDDDDRDPRQTHGRRRRESLDWED